MYVLKVYFELFESNVKFVKLCSYNYIYILLLDCLEVVEIVWYLWRVCYMYK